MEHSIGGSVNLRAKTDKSAHIDEGMIEAGGRIRNSLGIGIQIKRRTAILDPTGISTRSFARNIALGNILTERFTTGRESNRRQSCTGAPRREVAPQSADLHWVKRSKHRCRCQENFLRQRTLLVS